MVPQVRSGTGLVKENRSSKMGKSRPAPWVSVVEPKSVFLARLAVFAGVGREVNTFAGGLQLFEFLLVCQDVISPELKRFTR